MWLTKNLQVSFRVCHENFLRAPYHLHIGRPPPPPPEYNFDVNSGKVYYLKCFAIYSYFIFRPFVKSVVKSCVRAVTINGEAVPGLLANQ